MAFEFRLPELGEGIEGGEIVRLHVAEGDRVEKDQVLAEIETGKATVEIPSPRAGRIQVLHVQEGGNLDVGGLIVTLVGAGGEESSTEPETVSAPADSPSAEAPAGDSAPSQPPTPEEEDVVVSEPAEPKGGPSPASPPASAGALPVPPPRRPSAPASPSVRKFARELGIDVSEVRPSGARLSVDDVKQHVREVLRGDAGHWSGGPAIQPALPDFSRWGEIEREPMSSIRRQTASAMALAWSNIPHVTQNDRADVTAIERLRRSFGPQVEEKGGKLTVTAILIKVVAAALRVHPLFNASLDLARREIVHKRYVHIGVAVDTPRGLLVPVVRDADQKNILEISRDLSEMARKSRDGKVSPDDLQGGTFTITNLGGIGGEHFSPIVNFPEVAILGVGRTRTEPVWSEGQWQPRQMMPLSLSYDHRLIDGANAARFLRWVVDAIEQPFLLQLEG